MKARVASTKKSENGSFAKKSTKRINQVGVKLKNEQSSAQGLKKEPISTIPQKQPSLPALSSSHQKKKSPSSDASSVTTAPAEDATSWDMVGFCEKQLTQRDLSPYILLRLFNDRTQLYCSLELPEKIYLLLRTGVFTKHLHWNEEGTTIVIHERGYLRVRILQDILHITQNNRVAKLKNMLRLYTFSCQKAVSLQSKPEKDGESKYIFLCRSKFLTRNSSYSDWLSAAVRQQAQKFGYKKPVEIDRYGKRDISKDKLDQELKLLPVIQPSSKFQELCMSYCWAADCFSRCANLLQEVLIKYNPGINKIIRNCQDIIKLSTKGIENGEQGSNWSTQVDSMLISSAMTRAAAMSWSESDDDEIEEVIIKPSIPLQLFRKKRACK